MMVPDVYLGPAWLLSAAVSGMALVRTGIWLRVWRPIYGFDLMRRGPMLEGTARVYNLTEHGRTAKLELEPEPETEPGG